MQSGRCQHNDLLLLDIYFSHFDLIDDVSQHDMHLRFPRYVLNLVGDAYIYFYCAVRSALTHIFAKIFFVVFFRFSLSESSNVPSYVHGLLLCRIAVRLQWNAFVNTRFLRKCFKYCCYYRSNKLLDFKIIYSRPLDRLK